MIVRDTTFDTVVIGAGLAGLACARDLQDQGREVTVFDRAHGVGGRCATRRIAGQPVDHGVPFLHGEDPSFADAWRDVPGDRILGWPRVVLGPGRPCHPDAFRRGEHRLALASGVNALPRHLASSLDVRLQANIESLRPVANALACDVASLHGERPREETDALGPPSPGTSTATAFTCRTAVLAMAGEQVARLLRPLADSEPEVAAALALLAMTRAQPCLSLAALYLRDAPAPPWDMFYPDSAALQLISHDSAKRATPEHLALVLQSTPAFARRHQGEPIEAWTATLLHEAAAIVGDFVRDPTATHAHVWRFARIDPVGELGTPLLLRLRDGGVIGLAGEAFGRGAGTEAAYLSGRQLAQRLLQDDNP